MNLFPKSYFGGAPLNPQNSISNLELYNSSESTKNLYRKQVEKFTDILFGRCQTVKNQWELLLKYIMGQV